MNKFKQAIEHRQALLLDVFKRYHNEHYDDFFEGRDKLLEDIEEIFAKEYGVHFKCLAIDNYNTEGHKEARRILKELSDKV